MSEIAAPIDLTSTLGAYQIGILISMVLFGVLTTQTVTYYKRFPNDVWYLKLYVLALWIMELSHAILTSQLSYLLTVTHYGDVERISQFQSSLIGAIGLSGIIGPTVQAFFANRLRLVSAKWIVPCICWTLCFLHFLSVMAIVAASAQTRSILDFKKQWKWLLVTSLVISTATDVITSVALCYSLWRWRRYTIKAGRLERVVDKLIACTLQMGFLTSLATMTMLIMFLYVNNFAWISIIFIISRLFSNTLLASLNERTTLRDTDNKVTFIGDLNFHPQSTKPPSLRFDAEIKSEIEQS